MNSKRSAGVALAVLLGAHGPAIAQQSFSGPGVTIPDIGITSSMIIVSESGTVGDGLIISLTFAPEHTWAGDLSVTVSHNDGDDSASADLFRRIGKLSPTAGFGNSNDLNGTYRFSDAFGPSFWSPPASDGDINTGDYRAVTNLYDGQPGPLLNLNEIFTGRSLAGTWTLTIQDDASGDTGSLFEWSIISVLVPGPAALALGAIGVVGVGRRRRF